MKCPYCGGGVKLVSSSVVYKSKKLQKNKVWVCENYPTCDAYVGCHPGTEIPLGRLANEHLRNLKVEAHRQFDPIWKCSLMSRNEAYAWLADMLGLDPKDCHIGMFSPEVCKKVINICRRQDNPELRKYRLDHYGYEQYPTISRGYENSRSSRRRKKK